MKLKRLKVADLKPNEKNVRIHSEKQITEFKRSIKMFGVVRPVIVDENNVLLAGHGLTMALKELGITEVDAYVMTDLTEAQKLKLMLTDNKIYELGTTNFDYFNDVLKDIAIGGDLDVPGYDENILDTLVLNDEMIDDDITDYGKIDPEKIEQIKAQGEEYQKTLERENRIVTSSEDGEHEVVLNPEKIQVEINDDFADGNPRPFVICEHCGEKIWL